MSIVRILKKSLMFTHYLLKFKSAKLAYLFAFYNVSETDASGLRLTKGKLEVIANGNRVSLNQIPVFGFSTSLLIALLKCNRIKVTDCFDTCLIVQVGELTFKIHSLSNMAVIHELFVEDIYSFEIVKDNLVVVDIGMNVGVAATYFAAKPNVAHVYGYEPFPDTFNEANQNIALNQNLVHKFSLVNSGVSNVTEQRNIPLFESGLLSASTTQTNNDYGLIKDAYIQVSLISINEVMDRVISENPASPILLKIDCEGEEYAIFDMLSTGNYLDNVTCVMLEWHEKGIGNLESILLKNKFQLFHKHHVSENSGMIYAYKY